MDVARRPRQHTEMDDKTNPWGFTPYTARAIVALAEHQPVTEDLADIIEAADEYLTEENLTQEQEPRR